ncbi:hypothetical protein CPB86DRAFT_810411 [Serendipita vermifera]|nr:hypothetical protein CPB86DRAFT_810411 [Serendipita vermifera]
MSTPITDNSSSVISTTDEDSFGDGDEEQTASELSGTPTIPESVLRDDDTRAESVPVDTGSVMDEDSHPRVLNEPALVFDGSFMKKRYQLEELEDRKFEKELTDMIFALALQYQSWSTARPELEIRNRALAAQDRYNKIESRENAQEKTRLQAGKFLDMIRAAYNMVNQRDAMDIDEPGHQ